MQEFTDSGELLGWVFERFGVEVETIADCQISGGSLTEGPGNPVLLGSIRYGLKNTGFVDLESLADIISHSRGCRCCQTNDALSLDFLDESGD